MECDLFFHGRNIRPASGYSKRSSGIGGVFRSLDSFPRTLYRASERGYTPERELPNKSHFAALIHIPVLEAINTPIFVMAKCACAGPVSSGFVGEFGTKPQDSDNNACLG